MNTFTPIICLVSIILSGCGTVTYSPNNTMAISTDEANAFINKASQAKNLEEYSKVLGYDKKSGYYQFSDRVTDKIPISFRTFRAFCRANGGITDTDPSNVSKCQKPSYLDKTLGTEVIFATYCKIPKSDDSTKKSVDKLLYVFYSKHFNEANVNTHGKFYDVYVTDEVQFLNTTQACYEQAYAQHVVALAESAKRQEESNKRKEADLEKKRLADKQLADEKEAERRRKMAEISAFRKGEFKEEMLTNCGPILEVKKTMLKVYFPIKDYGNEHWIPKNEIFPEGYGCSFINGQYNGALLKY